MGMPSLREEASLGAEGDLGEGAAVHLELEVAAVVGADLPDPLDRRFVAIRCRNVRITPCALAKKRWVGYSVRTFNLATSKTNSLFNLATIHKGRPHQGRRGLVQKQTY